MNPFKYIYRVCKTLYLNLRFPFLCYTTAKGKKLWIYPYNWYNQIPRGWRRAFGIQLCKEIKENSNNNKFYILDIKEKYGSLQIYTGNSNSKIDKVLMKYEYISERTCIECGALATGYTPIEAWKCPYCDKCKPKNTLFIDFGLKIRANEKDYSSVDWYGYSGNINSRNTKDYLNEFKQYCEHF